MPDIGRCRGKAKGGVLCQNAPLPGKEFCRHHTLKARVWRWTSRLTLGAVLSGFFIYALPLLSLRWSVQSASRDDVLQTEARIDDRLGRIESALSRRDAGPQPGQFDDAVLARHIQDGFLLLAARDMDGAAAALSRAEIIAPNWYTAFLMGRVAAERGHPKAAVPLYRTAEARYFDLLRRSTPDVGKSNEQLLAETVARATGPQEPGVIFWADPQLSLIYGNLGAVLSDSGAFAEAEQVLRIATRLRAEDDLALTNLGFALHRQGRLKEAEEVLRRAARLNPSDPVSRADLGAVLKDLGDLDGAEVFFKEAIKLDATFANAWAGLGELGLSRRRYLEALAWFEMAKKLAPRNGSVLSNMAICQARLGRFVEAIGSAREAVEAEPGSASFWVNFGAVLFEGRSLASGNLELSRLAMEKAALLNPALPEARLGLGNALQASGNASAARKHYEQFLRLAETSGCCTEQRARVRSLLSQQAPRIRN